MAKSRETASAPELLERPGALVRVDAQALLSQALTSNAPIETVERMMNLLRDVRAWEARQAWFDALAQFQQRCPPIPKSKHADLGTFSYNYSPLDQVLNKMRPVMAPLGLSPRWKAGEIDAKSVSIICVLAHRLGHEEDSGKVILPIPESNRGANAMQRAAGAMTYAKRQSLLIVTGIQPEDEDSDGSDDPPGDDNKPGDYDHEGPPRSNPAGPEAERPALTDRIMRAIDRHRLTTEERLAIGKDWLPSGRMHKATIEELRKLELFLADEVAVRQWREERSAKPEQGEFP